ncbi:M67 family metallopeptidase [Pseudoflavitalea sp. G-6-1-2]|uniref:Mov34/MPN/PAD-1 family protein n=1 Tax=Pseudoflavitalea sp. G-6-1-2 TaxID=2728841 RepID=UPI001469BBC8|nr:M67 family metallopeptidase [Pseudoflavitalea sp. G-6-1-2]NML20899.1 M67 family metallopeptidase [Pseudoflavitalea sp. G-6-1-2]
MIIIDTQARAALLKDAVAAFPDECCGFLFGKEDENGLRAITEIQVVNNAKEGDKRRRFVIAPLDYIRAEEYADENQLQLLGVYHSHPNHPAIPSEHDRVAAQPWFSYIIVSVLDGKPDALRSWRLNDDSRFEEENVGIVANSYTNS